MRGCRNVQFIEQDAVRLPNSSHHVRVSGFQNPGNACLWNPYPVKILLVEFGVVGFGIRIP